MHTPQSKVTEAAFDSRTIPVAPSFKGVSDVKVEVRQGSTKVLSMVSALPANRYTQGELLDLLGYTGIDAAKAIFERSTVAARHLVLDRDGFCRTRDPYFQLQIAKEGSFSLAEEAILKILQTSGVALDEVGCLIVNTSSALQMPALGSLLVNKLRLPQTIVKYDLVGTGCVGAIPLFSLADDYLKSHPNKKVIAVCVDIGSKVLGKGDPGNKEAMVANSLFSDGAVGLLFGQDAAGHETAGLAAELVDTHYMQAYDQMDSAHLSVAPNGARTPHLHRQLPDRSAALFQPALDGLLTKHGLTRDDVAHWAFHPGGRAILDKLQGSLGLSEEQMAPSRYTLQNFGNVSSPTCLLALQQLEKTTRIEPGAWGIVGAVGPGLSVGIALVRWMLP